jgi:membrane-bound lytic murein transglycosylase A
MTLYNRRKGSLAYRIFCRFALLALISLGWIGLVYWRPFAPPSLHLLPRMASPMTAKNRPISSNGLTLVAGDFTDLPGWSAENGVRFPDLYTQRLKTQLQRNCPLLSKKFPDWQPVCNALSSLTSQNDFESLKTWLENLLRPWQLKPAYSQTKTAPQPPSSDEKGLFTGYFLPEISASKTPGAGFTTPIYKRPDDLIQVDLRDFMADSAKTSLIGRLEKGRLRPYWSRAEIEAGALAGKGLELAWTNDPIGLFFLHIQGSGLLHFTDNTRQLVGYDGQNGHSYYAIGRTLIALGAIRREEMSMQKIRAWLEDNPQKAPSLLQENPSYIFFKPLLGRDPLGALGVPLTPGQSLAIDRSLLPLGLPFWLALDKPPQIIQSLESTQTSLSPPENGDFALQLAWPRLLFAEDTGGAITGPLRGDVYWGPGQGAALAAGAMASGGQAWLLWPKASTPILGQ